MTMPGIDMHVLQIFGNGRMIGLTVNGGRYDEGVSKIGLTQRYIFGKGAISLMNKAGDIIAGPQNFDDVQLLATAIVEGNERALTTPGALLQLATAFLASCSVGIDTSTRPVSSKAVDDIVVERQRQIQEEGWTPEHDDNHGDYSLAKAACAYALGATLDTAERAVMDTSGVSGTPFRVKYFWPWNITWWKPTGRRRDLIKAAALIIAEIERIDRAAANDGSVA